VTTHVDPGAVVHRLDELRAELATGQEALRELDLRRSLLVARLVRLGGAVDALEELLDAHNRSERATVA
jgi:predicted nuclease with TOPRIM domain